MSCNAISRRRSGTCSESGSEVLMGQNPGAAIGSIAPNFSLKDGDNQSWNLADHRGKVVVLIFYPADETPVCTRQLCAVRDRWEDYTETGAEVVGISANTVESHKS